MKTQANQSQANSHKKPSFLASLFKAKTTATDSPPSPVVHKLFVVPQEKFAGRVSNQERWVFPFNYQEHLIHCREAYFQNSHARIYINRQVDMIVNDGLTLQFNPFWTHIDHKYLFEEQQAKQIEVQERWFLWASSLNSMLSSEMNFHVAQHELYKMLLRDGEFFVLLHRHYRDDLANPLRLQIVATDAVPYEGFGDHEESAKKRGNHIDHGIEFDANGQAVAYYFMNQDRSIKRVPTYAPDGRRWVIHVKRGDYLNSSRGVSALVNHLGSLAKIRDFEANELAAARLNAQFAAWVKPSQDQAATPVMLGETVAESSDVKVVPQIEGLVIQNLGAGQEFQPFAPNNNRPSSNLIDFIKGHIESMMVSEGMPYSVAMIHMDKSYSASRAELALFETFRKHRIEEFASKFLNVIFEQWLHEEVIYNDLILVGYSNSKKRKYLMNMTWHPDPIPDLDPLKSAKSMEVLIDRGILTHEQATRYYNDGNWDDNIERLAREEEKKQALGLVKSPPDEVIEVEEKEEEDE